MEPFFEPERLYRGLPTSESAPDDEAQTDPAEAPLTVRSEQLFQGARVLNILHEGATYQLRLTKLGKLILTK